MYLLMLEVLKGNILLAYSLCQIWKPPSPWEIKMYLIGMDVVDISERLRQRRWLEIYMCTWYHIVQKFDEENLWRIKHTLKFDEQN